MKRIVRTLAGCLLLSAALPAVAQEQKKVPGKDYPYGEGVVYKREVAFGSFAGGQQDGPGSQMECWDCPRTMAPSGNWYLIDENVDRAIRKYDAAKNRVTTIAWAGPAGKLGGLAECARFAGGGYHRSMGLSVDSDEKYLTIFDRNNAGFYWRLDIQKGTVEPPPGADVLQDAKVRGSGEDGCTYFAGNDGKLKKLLPDGKTVEELGVTLEQPLNIETFFGSLAVNAKLGRLYAATRDPYSPWGIVWYWDMKTGKATGVAGPKKGDKPDPNFRCASGPADKVSFWCGGGPALGPDRGERHVYYAGGNGKGSALIVYERHPAQAGDTILIAARVIKL